MICSEGPSQQLCPSGSAVASPAALCPFCRCVPVSAAAGAVQQRPALPDPAQCRGEQRPFPGAASRGKPRLQRVTRATRRFLMEVVAGGEPRLRTRCQPRAELAAGRCSAVAELSRAWLGRERCELRWLPDNGRGNAASRRARCPGAVTSFLQESCEPAPLRWKNWSLSACACPNVREARGRGRASAGTHGEGVTVCLGAPAAQRTRCEGPRCSVRECGFVEFSYDPAGIGCSHP